MTKDEAKALRQEWRTPPDFWEVLDGEFQFQIDVAASRVNALCSHYLTKEMDALDPRTQWLEDGCMAAYCNPGFGQPGPWHKRAVFETNANPGGVVVIMALVSPSTECFRFAEKYAQEIRLLSPRIQFKPPNGVMGHQNPRENCVVIYRRTPHFTNLKGPRAHIWVWHWK